MVKISPIVSMCIIYGVLGLLTIFLTCVLLLGIIIIVDAWFGDVLIRDIEVAKINRDRYNEED